MKTRTILCGLGLGFLAALSGCQSHLGGQTLPSPYYVHDDVQYHAPAPSEMKLTREAAVMKAYNAQRQLDRR